MFKKTRYIHHLGRLYLKPLPSNLINESFNGVTAGSRGNLSPEQMAIASIQSMHELGLIDDNYLTDKGRVVVGEYLRIKEQYENQQKSESSLIDKELERTKDYIKQGELIAKECYENGLLKGEIVKYQEIQNYIKKNHEYNSQVIENGFLKQISTYINDNKIISTKTDESGIIFIHVDYASEYLKNA